MFPASVCLWTHQFCFEQKTQSACAPVTQHLPEKTVKLNPDNKSGILFCASGARSSCLTAATVTFVLSEEHLRANKSRKLDSDTHLPPGLSQMIGSQNTAAPSYMCAYGSNHGSMTCRDCSLSFPRDIKNRGRPSLSRDMTFTAADVCWHPTRSSAPWLRHMKGLLLCQFLCLQTVFYC